MHSIQFSMLPPPAILKNDIECIRIAEYCGERAIAIKTSPNGVSGIVFQQHNGHAALEKITMHSGRKSYPTPFFLYGPVTEPSVMAYKSVSFTTIQVIFKPHALKTLFGIDASLLAHGWAEPHEFWHEDLTDQLMNAHSEQERLTLLISFLMNCVKQEKPRDTLVEESLRLIQTNIGTLRIQDLLDTFAISERQFERRFTQTVGITPHVYLRLKRFNEAIRLIKSRNFARLTDIAAALNFADQSHFIRDIKAFSGITPTGLSQKVDDFYHDQTGYSFV